MSGPRVVERAWLGTPAVRSRNGALITSCNEAWSLLVLRSAGLAWAGWRGLQGARRRSRWPGRSRRDLASGYLLMQCVALGISVSFSHAKILSEKKDSLTVPPKRWSMRRWIERNHSDSSIFELWALGRRSDATGTRSQHERGT